MKINVYGEDKDIIVEFEDIAIRIPSGHKNDISNVKLSSNNKDIVYFNVNSMEDFLSISTTILGEEPYYKPFKYSIISEYKDTKILIKYANQLKNKELNNMSEKSMVDKGAYEEVCMVLGDVFCARTDENGELYIKVYNENTTEYRAYFRLDLNKNTHFINGSYPKEDMPKLLSLLDKEMKFIVDWAGEN